MAYKAIQADVSYLYGAICDELDEDTAMFKITASKDQLPDEAESKLIPLNLDNQSISYPTDWYLHLANQVQKMLDGTIGFTYSITINPADEPLDTGGSGDYLDDCHRLSGWLSGGYISFNTTDTKQGTGCIQFDGTETNEFSKVFINPYNCGVTEANGILKLWFYVDDVSCITNVQIVIGSLERPDLNEYS